MRLFDEAESTKDLDELLRTAGFDPDDPKISAVKRIISRYYAGRTAEVLQRVQEVLSRFTDGHDNEN
ncbi:MAG TPA: hypothetical protein VIJ67_11915 [Pseudolabrys sp.]